MCISGAWAINSTAVNDRKKRLLTKTALDYLKQLGNPAVKLRFDIVEVLLADGNENSDASNEVPDDRTMSDLWEAEWQQAIVKQCMDLVRSQVSESTLEAFELFTLKGWPADKVTSHLGITRNAVFLGKRRVLSRMRELEDFLDANW